MVSLKGPRGVSSHRSAGGVGQRRKDWERGGAKEASTDAGRVAGGEELVDVLVGPHRPQVHHPPAESRVRCPLRRGTTGEPRISSTTACSCFRRLLAALSACILVLKPGWCVRAGRLSSEYNIYCSLQSNPLLSKDFAC